MAGMSETVRETLAKMAETVGLKASDARQLEGFAQKLSSAKAANIDKLEDLKEEIRGLEVRALKKKKEYDEAKGAVRKILAGEVEQLFRELDRRQSRANILARNIDRISIAQSKIEEIRVAQLQGASDDEIDTIALQAAEKFEALEIGDRAVADLEKERYNGRGTEPVDIESRAAELDRPAKDSAELSDDAKNRLKELEGEGS
jgi:hypothetical protein